MDRNEELREIAKAAHPGLIRAMLEALRLSGETDPTACRNSIHAASNMAVQSAKSLLMHLDKEGERKP